MDNQEIKFDKNNLVGLRYGKWKVLLKLEGGAYAVECDCGFETVKKGFHLMSQSTKQCFRCRIKERKLGEKSRKDNCLDFSSK